MSEWFSKPLINAINEHLSMRDLLEEAGVEVPFNGMVYCPFHSHHYDTKSAKVYDFERGNSLYCFSEQRTYRPYHMVKQIGLDKKEVRMRLPEGAIKVDEENSHSGKVLTLPVVDVVSMQEFKDSGDLVRYLDVLETYWTHRETLVCKDYQRPPQRQKVEDRSPQQRR